MNNRATVSKIPEPELPCSRSVLVLGHPERYHYSADADFLREGSCWHGPRLESRCIWQTAWPLHRQDDFAPTMCPVCGKPTAHDMIGSTAPFAKSRSFRPIWPALTAMWIFRAVATKEPTETIQDIDRATESRYVSVPENRSVRYSCNVLDSYA